jgi:hypothetical protein
VSRHVQIIPKDRTLTREAWKAIDRTLRTVNRDLEEEMKKAYRDALIYGRGEMRGLAFVPTGVDIAPRR